MWMCLSQTTTKLFMYRFWIEFSSPHKQTDTPQTNAINLIRIQYILKSNTQTVYRSLFFYFLIFRFHLSRLIDHCRMFRISFFVYCFNLSILFRRKMIWNVAEILYRLYFYFYAYLFWKLNITQKSKSLHDDGKWKMLCLILVSTIKNTKLKGLRSCFSVINWTK